MDGRLRLLESVGAHTGYSEHDYLIGSTFKAMSTVALLQQMEQGKFKLDDRVNDYLTEFKIQNEDPKNPVTFRHLFTHTSGLPGGFGAFPVWGDTVPPPLEEYLSKSLVISKPTGSEVIYSNTAYTLIGYLVQKFSGVPYKKYIQDNIFTPLEMTNTAFEPTPAMDERISMPYTVDEKTGQPASGGKSQGIGLAGGNCVRHHLRSIQLADHESQQRRL